MQIFSLTLSFTVNTCFKVRKKYAKQREAYISDAVELTHPQNIGLRLFYEKNKRVARTMI